MLSKKQLDFINDAHENHCKKGEPQRYGEHPYFYHLKFTADVARVFSNFYPILDDEEVLLACYGHDILEDTTIKVDDLKSQGFPDKTIDIICRVTDEPGKNRKERKLNTYPKIKGNTAATAVKLCDRIANLLHNINTDRKDLVSMYRREHKEFEEALRVPGELEDMWKAVDRIINTHYKD